MSTIRKRAAQVDRGERNARRDYAMIMLMGVYGLRVSEVLTLRLDLVDWEHDKIRFHRPKTKDCLDLPLLPEVGNAVIEYLQMERPAVTVPELFVLTQKHKDRVVQAMVKRYMKKAGIEPFRHVTSLFRHSLAMEMVKQSVSVKTIADTLGHRRLETTFAVHRLLQWYQDGDDVQAKLPILSQYLGHTVRNRKQGQF